MNSITINGQRVAVTTIRINRRTFQLKIISPAQIEIRAPFTMTDNEIQALLTKKHHWLASHLIKASPTPPSVLPPKLLFFGEEIPLRRRITTTSAITATRTADSFLLTHPPAASLSDLRHAVTAYYRQTAKTVLTAKTDLWAERIGVTYNRITIKEQKTRWGSCSAKHNLNYNWRIIQAPDDVIDYVVIHELCHLRYLNHSSDFWRLVAVFDPHYAEHRRYLRQMGSRLTTSL